MMFNPYYRESDEPDENEKGQMMLDVDFSESHTMTVREVADVLGVTPEAIKWHIREIYPDLLKKGVKTLLTEEHVTEVKKRMAPTSQLVGAKTDLEIAEMTVQVLEHFKAKADILSRQIQEQAPKVEAHDRFLSSEDTHTLADVAKSLGFGPVKFCEMLRADGILFKRDGENVAYQEHLEHGRFILRYIPFLINNEHGSALQTRVTTIGIDWLSRKYKKQEKAK